MIAIVVGSHGHLSKELIGTAEMIIGKQDNIGYVEFFAGEGIETLVEKYEEQFNQLDTTDGILVLTDIFGGSPFNAACTIAMGKRDMDVIAGTNIPMVIEAFVNRETETLENVVNSVLEISNTSIKTFRKSVLVHSITEEQEEL